MHIFIDESGSFTCSSNQAHSISAVGALVIPSSSLKGFEKLYRRVRSALPKHAGEVKGRLLSESDVSDVVTVLKKVGAIFEIVAIDMGQHSSVAIKHHKENQETAITAHLTAEHHPNVISGVWELRRTLEALPIQLYVQSVMMGELVYCTLNHANTYYAFRMPQELGEYHWTIDAKEKSKITPWEDWWSKIILPMTESHSFREPFIAVKGADYRWHERMRTHLDDYKRQFMKDPERGEAFDLKPILTEDFRFSSDPESGLEAVDVLTNAIRRSMAGNFSREGWMDVRRIMVHRKDQYINIVHLSEEYEPQTRYPYSRMLRDFRHGGRSMVPANYFDD